MTAQLGEYIDNGMLFLSITAILLILSVLSLLLFIIKIFQIFRKKEVEPVAELEAGEDDIAFVIKGDMIEFQGQKLKYFMLKDNTTKPEKLRIGQKVKVIKKNNTEAYVKAAS